MLDRPTKLEFQSEIIIQHTNQPLVLEILLVFQCQLIRQHIWENENIHSFIIKVVNIEHIYYNQIGLNLNLD